MRQKVNLLLLITLSALLLAACKLTQTIATAPAFQPTDTASPAATFTPPPTATPTFPPTATLDRGRQDTTTGHWYALIPVERSWLTSREYCLGMGAHLVTLSNAKENQLVYSLSPATWLGASDEDSPGRWAWVSGETLSYTNWAPGQPAICTQTDCQPGHYLAFAPGSSQWEVLPARQKPFICEWDQ